MFRIPLDTPKTFECVVQVDGAPLSETTVRLVIDTKSFALVFPGTIDTDGNVTVEIPKLNKLIPEGKMGPISLEVVVDDTIFYPFNDTYETFNMKSVQIEDDSIDVKVDGKPVMNNNVERLASALSKKGITSANISDDQTAPIIMAFMKSHKIDRQEASYIIGALPQVMLKYS